VNRDARLVNRDKCPVIRDPRTPGNANLQIGEFEAPRETPEKLAIRNGVMLAPRDARTNFAREQTTPHQFASRGLNANPPTPRKFRKPAIFSTPARS
jgi:hypothetical protein